VIRDVLEAMSHLGLQVSPSNDVHRIAVLESATQLELYPLSRQLADAMHSLLDDANVKEAIRRSRWYQFNESAVYYFKAIDRISSTDYCPTDSDVLYTCTKTTGISQTTFKVAGCHYRVFDVGGTRSERRKWIHCFEKTSAVIFLVALSEYNQRLYEDESVVKSTSFLPPLLSLTLSFLSEPYARIAHSIQLNMQFLLVR
jgi:guanine nucleotide-binding protein subunit alpha